MDLSFLLFVLLLFCVFVTIIYEFVKEEYNSLKYQLNIMCVYVERKGVRQSIIMKNTNIEAKDRARYNIKIDYKKIRLIINIYFSVCVRDIIKHRNIRLEGSGGLMYEAVYNFHLFAVSFLFFNDT